MATVKFVTSDGTEKKNEAGEVINQVRRIETEYDFGSSLKDAVEMYGEEVVFSSYVASAKVDAQALVRRLLKTNVPAVEGISTERPHTDEEIVAALSKWKPGVKSERAAASVSDKAEALLGKMTDAQKAEFLAKLQALAGL